MKKMLLILSLCFGFLFAGCSAGSAYELMANDVIIATSTEVHESLVAYDVAIQELFEKRQKVVWDKLERDLIKLALSNDETPESAKANAEYLTTAAQKDLGVILTDDRERQAQFETASDNLKYIIEISERIKDFVLYRSNVSEQWKQYLQAQRTELFRKKAGE